MPQVRITQEKFQYHRVEIYMAFEAYTLYKTVQIFFSSFSSFALALAPFYFAFYASYVSMFSLATGIVE